MKHGILMALVLAATPVVAADRPLDGVLNARISGDLQHSKGDRGVSPAISGHALAVTTICGESGDRCGAFGRLSVGGGLGPTASFQAHTGVAALSESGYFAGPLMTMDLDSRLTRELRKELFDGVFGAELGKVFRSGDHVVIVGAHGGLGAASGNSPGVAPIRRTGAAGGLSLAARLGAPNTPGTVLVAGSLMRMAGASRSDASIDCNVARHLQIGAGWRQSQLQGLGSVSTSNIRTSLSFGGARTGKRSK